MTQYLTQYSNQPRITPPRFIIFTNWNRHDLGYKALTFASSRDPASPILGGTLFNIALDILINLQFWLQVVRKIIKDSVWLLKYVKPC